MKNQKESLDITLVLLASGSSMRFQSQGFLGQNKLFISIAGKPILFYSLQTLLHTGLFKRIVIVVKNDDDRIWIASQVLPLLNQEELNKVEIDWVFGGSERAVSVYNAMKFLEKILPKFVMIHDGARPALRRESIDALFASFKRHPNAILAAKVTDTLKKATEAQLISGTIDRKALWGAQTPQLFTFSHLMEAYQAGFHGATDESEILENTSYPVALVENLFPNPKLTFSADIPYMEWLLKHAQCDCTSI